MLLATKGNREVRISPNDKEKYLNAGYSLFEKDGNGKLRRVKGTVKKTPAMIALEKENEALKKKLASIEVTEEEPEKKPARGRAK